MDLARAALSAFLTPSRRMASPLATTVCLMKRFAGLIFSLSVHQRNLCLGAG
jgi:hypothetical protein